MPEKKVKKTSKNGFADLISNSKAQILTTGKILK